jgi:hypothetical protein
VWVNFGIGTLAVVALVHAAPVDTSAQAAPPLPTQVAQKETAARSSGKLDDDLAGLQSCRSACDGNQDCKARCKQKIKSAPEWVAESSRYHSCSSACRGNSACIVHCAELHRPGRDAASAAMSGHGGTSYRNCVADECAALNTICFHDHLASACDANSRCMARCARIHGTSGNKR